MLTYEMHGHIVIIIGKAVIKNAPFTVDETLTQYLYSTLSL